MLFSFLILFTVPLSYADDSSFTTQFGATPLNDDGLFYGFGIVSIDNDGNVFVMETAKQRIQKFSPNGEFLAKWGSAGTKDGQFVSPSRMAFDSQGNVYVSDRLNDNIQKFTSAGKFLVKLDGRDFEKNNGQFTNPQFIAVDSQDNIYLADNENLQIQKFSSDGQFLTNWDVYSVNNNDPEFTAPHILSVDSQDNIYVADIYRIQKFSSDGTLISTWDTFDTIQDNLPNSMTMAIDFSGNSYVIDISKTKITKFSSDGILLSSQVFSSLGTTENLMRFALGMTFDNDDNLYAFDLADFNVKKFDIDGKPILSFGNKVDLTDQLDRPNVVAVDSKDNVYVETRNGIQKFSSDGTTIGKLTLAINDIEITDLTNILFDSFDNMYVSNQQSRIAEFTSDGNFIKEYDIFRVTEDYVLPSIGIAMDSENNLYTIGSGSERIQKFTSDGDLVTTWEYFDTKDKSSLTPTAIVVDSQDNIYVAYQISLIQKFSPDGKFLTEWASPSTGKGQFFNIFAMAADSKNNIYVAALEHDKIIQFSPDGEFLTEWGFSGTGEGTFAGIKGIAVDSKDNVYVSDYGNSLLQKFHNDSIFITKTKNSPPIANAGEDQHVDEGTRITLDGTKSTDSDKTIPDTNELLEQIQFEWIQIDGPIAGMSDNTIANPVIDIPIIDEESTVLSFNLTVTDYVGTSSSDVVKIHVNAKDPSKTILSEPMNLSDNNEANTSYAVLTTSDNFVYVLWSESTPDNTELLLRVSRDGGTTFQDSTSVWKTQYPMLNLSATSSGNNVYVTWTEGITSTGPIIFVSSHDNGNSFSQPVTFSDPGLSPDVFVSKDNVYVAWIPLNQDTGSRDTIHLKISHDGGQNFAKQTLPTSKQNISDVKVFSSEDKTHLVWSESENLQDRTTYYMQSVDDDGKTFTDSIKIATNVVSIDSVQVSENNIYVLLYKQEEIQTASMGYSYGKVSLMQSDDGGKSFVEILASEDPAGHYEATEYENRNLNVSENIIYLTWTEYSQTDEIKLYVVSSTDGGKTITKTFVDFIPEIPFGPNQVYFDIDESPHKIVSSGQNVNLVYQKPIKSGDDIHSFLVKSNDSGKTFEKRIKLGNAYERYSEFSPRIVSSDGWIHAIWISGKISLPFPVDADTFYSKIEMKVNPVSVDLGSYDEYDELSTSDLSVEQMTEKNTKNDLEDKETSLEDGGCLIATAAHGTELAPQVQYLREIRDNTVLSTASGSVFMTGFNTIYYSFAPAVADMERENPMFQDAVRVFITPMISSLSIMSLAENGSEIEVLGLGIFVILLNLGMYIAAPALIGIKIRNYFKPRELG